MSKFLPGNNANPKGRPKTAFALDFDSLMAKKRMHDEGSQIVSDKWADIVEAIVQQAMKGNVQAATFLRDTFIGKPKDSIQHDVSDELKKSIHISIIKDESDL